MRPSHIKTYPFLKKYKSPLMDVAASNTRSLLHRSPPGLGWPGFGSSGSSGSGAGGGVGLGLGSGLG